MKKVSIITALLVGIGIFAFVIANPTSAAELFRGGPTGTEVGGSGRRGASGTGTGVPMERNINLDGALSDLIHENLAASLGITPEELTARLDGGETLYEIALSLGFDQTSVIDMISQARADALAQAVADGLITQEQADWLSSRGSMRAGSGNGSGRRGAIGTGTGVPMERNINLDGALSDLIHENLAVSLGTTPEELTARLDGGETLSEIALSLGFDQTSVMDMISQARADALAQAVADGLITQEQADWLSSRGSMQAGSGNGSGAGTCDGTGAHASGSSSAMKGKGEHNSRGGQNH